MALSFSTALRNARATAIKNAIDAGLAAGTRKIYTGPRPASGAAITTQTLLGTLTFSYPCGTVVDGVLTFDTITQDSYADATGDAVWYRDSDSTGAFVMDGSITVTGGGGDMTMNTVSIVTGGAISVTGTKTITEGGA
jgi:hypothetical protein